jgi:hypothetical protein
MLTIFEWADAATEEYTNVIINKWKSKLGVAAEFTETLLDSDWKSESRLISVLLFINSY